MRHNKGHGKVDLEMGDFFSVNDFTATASDDFSEYLSAYDDHLDAYKKDILELLK